MPIVSKRNFALTGVVLALLVVINSVLKAKSYNDHRASCIETAELEIYADAWQADTASLATTIVCEEAGVKRAKLNWLDKWFIVGSIDDDANILDRTDPSLTDEQKARILRAYITLIYPELRLRRDADRPRNSNSVVGLFLL